MINIYFYTVKIAFFSTLIAAIIGFPMGYFTSHKIFKGRNFILSLSSVPLCVPPLIVVLGYIGFFGVNGFVSNHFYKSTFLYSWFGVIIAQGFYNFPFITGIVNDAWKRLSVQEENAALMLGAKPSRIFFTITLPKLTGTIASACIPVFLFCFFSFMIVLLFSTPGSTTMEVELYRMINSTEKIGNGLFYVIIQTVTAMAMVLLYSKLTRKNELNTFENSFIQKRTKEFSIFQKCGLVILLILILIFFICPFLSIVVSSLTTKLNGQKILCLNNYSSLLLKKEFYKAFGYSCFVGLFTGLICSLSGFCYSMVIRFCKKENNSFLLIIPIIPMAISSVVVCWICSLLFPHSNIFMLIVLQSFLYWPIAYRQIFNSISKVSFECHKSALLLSKNSFDSIIRFYLPSSKNIIISSFLYSFAISFGDSTFPLVLSIRNFNSLSLYTYKLAASYKFNQSCACGIIICLFTIIIRILYNRKYEKDEF